SAAARAPEPRDTQSAGCTGSASTACQVAASVSPLGGRPREVCKLVSACSVDVPKTPSTGTVGEKDTRCSCSQTTSSPLEPLSRAGHPGSWSGSAAPGGWPSAAHVDGAVACQLHHDSPPAP